MGKKGTKKRKDGLQD